MFEVFWLDQNNLGNAKDGTSGKIPLFSIKEGMACFVMVKIALTKMFKKLSKSSIVDSLKFFSTEYPALLT